MRDADSHAAELSRSHKRAERVGGALVACAPRLTLRRLQLFHHFVERGLERGAEQVGELAAHVEHGVVVVPPGAQAARPPPRLAIPRPWACVARAPSAPGRPARCPALVRPTRRRWSRRRAPRPIRAARRSTHRRARPPQGAAAMRAHVPCRGCRARCAPTRRLQRRRTGRWRRGGRAPRRPRAPRRGAVVARAPARRGGRAARRSPSTRARAGDPGDRTSRDHPNMGV